MSNWARFKRIICCNSTDPYKQYERIYQCVGCGNGFHRTCLGKVQNCDSIVFVFESENQMAIELAKEIE
jgi:hypothetical protein